MNFPDLARLTFRGFVGTGLAAALMAGCATPPPPPPPPPPERATSVGETEGPQLPPMENDWPVENDATAPLGAGMTPSNISFSPKGDKVAVAAWVRQAKHETRDAEILMVSLSDPDTIERIKVDGKTDNGELRLSWSHDGKSIAYSTGHDIRIYDLATKRSRLLNEWKGTGSRSVRSLTYSPDDRRLAALVTRPVGVRYAVIAIRVRDGDTQEYPVADQTVELAGWSAGESLALVEWDRKPGAEAKKRIGALDLETGKREKWALPRGLDAACATTAAGFLAIDPEGVVWELGEGKWERRFVVQHKLQAPASEASRDTLHFDGIGLAPGGRVAVVTEVEADGSGGSGILRVLRLKRSDLREDATPAAPAAPASPPARPRKGH